MTSRGKIALFSILMVAIPVVVPSAAVLGYYAYQKVTTPAIMAGSYGILDAELGWRLKAKATSRYWMQDRLTGETYFDSHIATNADGFRSAAGGDETPAGAILSIGDSWTFGYAVNYDETYPAQLSALLERPVVNMGVPAYGSAQTLLLLQRHVARLRPQVVIYLTRGLWQRSHCHGRTRPQHVLKPCFWLNPDGNRVELVTPRPGYVETMAALGVYPGGWLTAGNSTWAYYLISRPITKIKQLLTAAGLFPGHQTEYDNDPLLGALARKHELNLYLDLARRHGFIFLLVDPNGNYAAAAQQLQENYGKELSYFTSEKWADQVERRASTLPREAITVPKDGHYTAAMNGIIAQAFSDHLDRQLVRR